MIARVPMVDDAQAHEIAELRAEIAALRAAQAADRAELRERVARLEAAAPPRPSRAARAALLPVLAMSVQARAFTAVEVVAHAAVDARLADALAAAGIRNARQLGHYLARAERRKLGPVDVVRIGSERDGAIWRCVPPDVDATF